MIIFLMEGHRVNDLVRKQSNAKFSLLKLQQSRAILRVAASGNAFGADRQHNREIRAKAFAHDFENA